MTIAPGTDVTVKIPNARVARYDPTTDRYFVHSPAFYGGAWVDAHNATPSLIDHDDGKETPAPHGNHAHPITQA